MSLYHGSPCAYYTYPPWYKNNGPATTYDDWPDNSMTKP